MNLSQCLAGLATERAEKGGGVIKVNGHHDNLKLKLNYNNNRDNYRQVYKDLAFCENPLEREHEVEDVKVEKIRSLQEVKLVML